MCKNKEHMKEWVQKHIDCRKIYLNAMKTKARPLKGTEAWLNSSLSGRKSCRHSLAVEHLPRMFMVLGSIPSDKKNRVRCFLRQNKIF